MPNSFTPQQIEQFLQEFFDVVGARQYIGARYVPIFGRAGEDTVEWDAGAPYEPLTVVMHLGVSYVSRRYVPTGIQITDTDYWFETYRFNAQVEQYRQEVLGFSDRIDDVVAMVQDDYVPFPDPSNYPKFGTVGQVLSTLSDGTTKWEDPVVPSDEQAETIITGWLDDHPEATTTVLDGSITNQKIANGTVMDAKLAANYGVRSGLDYVTQLVSGQIQLTYAQGRFVDIGYEDSANYIRVLIPYVAGRSLTFRPIGTADSVAFSAYNYVSETSGTQVFRERTGGLTITPTGPIVVNVRRNPIASTDPTMGNRMLLVCDSPNVIERLDSADQDIVALEALTSPLVSTDITDKAIINAYLAELYIANPVQGKTYTVGTFHAMDDGNLRVVIRDSDDWVCFFQRQLSTLSAGVAYYLPPYQDNVEYGWFVLKTTDITQGYSGAARLIDSVYRLNAWPTIQRALTAEIEDHSQRIEEIEQSISTLPLTGRTLVCLGDSIFGQNHSATGIPALLGDITGATAHNCALGGTRGGYRASGFWQYYDFPGLSQAIASGDYTDQRAHTSESGVPSYFADVIEDLAGMDWSSVDLITVCYGGNDYTGGETTIAQFVADMAAAVNRIIQAHPSIRVLLVTPPYKYFMDASHAWTGDGSTVQYNGLYLNDFVAAYSQVGEATFSPVCDIYTGLGINRHNTALWFAENDGSHPSEAGRRITARYVAPSLERM